MEIKMKQGDTPGRLKWEIRRLRQEKEQLKGVLRENKLIGQVEEGATGPGIGVKIRLVEESVAAQALYILGHLEHPGDYELLTVHRYAVVFDARWEPDVTAEFVLVDQPHEYSQWVAVVMRRTQHPTRLQMCIGFDVYPSTGDKLRDIRVAREQSIINIHYQKGVFLGYDIGGMGFGQAAIGEKESKMTCELCGRTVCKKCGYEVNLMEEENNQRKGQ